MAAIQKSQDIDTLSVRKIFAKGDNNTTLAANSILITDGKGGTQWIDMSTFQRGINFNTIETTQSSFTSGPASSKFAILDGINAGLLPSASGNSVTMYAKAFGQIDVLGQDSIYSFDTYTGTINSNVGIIGAGVIDIATDTTNNIIQFYSPDTGLSSLSSVVGNFKELNGHIGEKITSFNSPFSTFIYDAISSYSTMYKLNTEILNTSTVQQQGIRQPFIQSGSGVLSSDTGTAIITLTKEYSSNNYTIQLTYRSNIIPPSNKLPLVFTNVNSANFTVYGDKGGLFHWTTYGNLF